MILDAFSLDIYQRCGRRSILSRDWRVIRHRPKSLFDRCLRAGILEISSGVDAASAASAAKSTFLELAANPGMEYAPSANPYLIAKDYCAMLSTILLALERMTLLTVHAVLPTSLAADVSWRTLAVADDTGSLHRWITVDSWSPSDLARELHSWYVMGDLAVAEAPLTVHVIEIGQQRKGRHASAWSRGFVHPTMPNLKLHFARKSGRPLEGWKPSYLADDPIRDAADWVEQMFAEGVAQPLVHHVAVRVPSVEVIAETRRQIVAEARGMAAIAATPYTTLPMIRSACDALVPCPFQWVCYSEGVVDVAAIGLYERRQPDRPDRPGRPSSQSPEPQRVDSRRLDHAAVARP